MRRFAIAAALAPFLAAAALPAREAAAQAAPLRSTGDLLAICDATEAGVVRLAQCNGFIVGTGLTYRELLQAGTIRPMACAPANSTLDEARAGFVTWARGNPGEHGADAVDGFWQAMAARWPCGG